MAKQSLIWRVYAAFIAATFGSYFLIQLLSRDLSRGTLISLAMVVAVVGVVGWAYGCRIGPTFVWRLFAIAFAVAMAWIFGNLWRAELTPLFQVQLSKLVAFAILSGLTTSMIIALFRYSASPTEGNRDLVSIFE